MVSKRGILFQNGECRRQFLYSYQMVGAVFHPQGKLDIVSSYRFGDLVEQAKEHAVSCYSAHTAQLMGYHPHFSLDEMANHRARTER